MKRINTYRKGRFINVIIGTELFIVLACLSLYILFSKVYETVVFEREILFIALISTVLISIISLVYLLRKNRAVKKFTDEKLLPWIIPDLSQGKLILKYLLFRVAMLLLVIALINPKYGIEEVEATYEGVDLMLALDVSNSMKAEDFTPSRLEKAKQSIKILLDKLHGDKIGMVVFAGEAYVQFPITSDYAAANMFLSYVSTNVIPRNRQGTAIGAAIELATESFDETSESNKAIIVITDGENHEDDAILAASSAKELGIMVHTIGMGSEEGAPIPIKRGNRRIGFQKDKNGETVISKLDENNLREIAGAGGGTFVRASQQDAGLNYLLDEIEQMEKTTYDSKLYADYKSYFFPFLFCAFLLILIESFVSERKSKWIDKLKIFEA